MASSNSNSEHRNSWGMYTRYGSKMQWQKRPDIGQIIAFYASLLICHKIDTYGIRSYLDNPEGMEVENINRKTSCKLSCKELRKCEGFLKEPLTDSLKNSAIIDPSNLMEKKPAVSLH